MRSDVFSLATTVAHALLGGGLPADFHWEKKVYLRELQDCVPEMVIALLLEAMSRDPDERPDSVAAFVEAMAGSVEAPTTSAWEAKTKHDGQNALFHLNLRTKRWNSNRPIKCFFRSPKYGPK